MQFLIMANIDTDEILNKIELVKVSNICVFTGDRINNIGTWYGCHCDPYEKYLMVQYNNCSSFIVGNIKEAYIYFE
jgi:hypothetical protein